MKSKEQILVSIIEANPDKVSEGGAVHTDLILLAMQAYASQFQPPPSASHNIEDAGKEWVLTNNQMKQGDIFGYPEFSQMTAFKAGAAWQSQQSNKVDGWIRIEDGLPEMGKDVMVRINGYTQTFIGFHNGVDWFANFVNGQYKVQFEKELPDDPEIFVTHWRPLPTPPNQ